MNENFIIRQKYQYNNRRKNKSHGKYVNWLIETFMPSDSDNHLSVNADSLEDV